MTQLELPETGERSRLLTLVFTDLVNSVGLKSRLGDTEAGRLISAHYEGLREACMDTGGREILMAGDGCFLTFETPSQAVEFALRTQDYHRRNPGLPQVRIGLHMGEVTEKIQTGPQGRTVEIGGLAVDIASRIQNLASPRQILMSYSVFDNARQRLDSSAISLPVEWRAHGRYVFQGTDMALEIFEAGLKGVATFSRPAGSTKAQRDIQEEDEHTLGWRPAQGLELPGRPNWILIEKLGEGGFGDVWLSEHRKTRDRHVIKFCYNPDRLRTLKREVTLFRLLKESLGDREDIARVLDYQFETSPYFLEMEFAGHHNLSAWLEENGGVENIPLEKRLEVVAQVADAIAAAHSVGVLHKDIKPSNIMVTEKVAGKPRVRMIDFGIGAVADRHLLDVKGITATGLTEAESSPEYASSLTGTRLYMAPELIEGKTATIKSDIYSLGVLLYQMASGHIGQTLSFGWERDVPDEILQEDILACVDGRPENRLSSAEELANRLRRLPERRKAREAAKFAAQRAANSKRRRRLAYVGAVVMCTLLIIIIQFAAIQHEKASAEEQLRKRADAARLEAQQQAQQTEAALQEAQQARYYGSIALAEASLRGARFDKAEDVLFHETPRSFLQREWGWLLAQSAPEDFAFKKANIFDSAFTPDGTKFVTGNRDAAGHGHISVYDSLSASFLGDVKTNIRLVWNLAISPDGETVATASSDNVVSIVDISTSTPAVRRKLTANRGIVRDVAFSPDGEWVASCSRDKTIRLWNTSNYKHKRVIRVEADSFTEIAFSPDSRYIVSGSLESHVQVFEVATGNEFCRLAGHQDRVLSVGFLADGTGVVTACKDSVTRIYNWPPPQGQIILQPVISVRTEDSYPAQVLSSPDGRSVYIGNDNGLITKVNSKTGMELNSIQVDQPLWKMSICGGGKRLLTASRWSFRMLDLERLEGEVTVSDWTDQTTVPAGAIPIPAHAVVNLRDQTWNADQPWRTTSGLSLVTGKRGNQFLVHSVFDVYSPDRAQHIDIDPQSLSVTVSSTSGSQVFFENSKRQIVGARYSPNGKQAALMFEGVGTRVYETENWTRLYTIPQPRLAPTSLIYTPGGKELIIGYVEGLIQSYRASDGEPLKQLYAPGAGAPLSLDLNPSGRYLAAGLDIDRILVIDLQETDSVTTMIGHVRYVHGVKFVARSNRLASMSRDGTVKLWDTKTGRELVTLFSLANGVVPLGITFDPTGRHIHIATSDRRVITTDVFPWNLEAYGDAPYPLEDRVELWKRRMRLSDSIQIEDVVQPMEELQTAHQPVEQE